MNSLEEAFYAAVGMALKGKKKVEQTAKKIVKESKMESKQGKVFVDKTVKHAEEVTKELSKKIDESVRTAATKMGFITRNEAEKLKAQIKKLQDQLGKPAKKKPVKKAKKAAKKK